jgi:DNA-binding beta-propeller fold protein YncE
MLVVAPARKPSVLKLRVNLPSGEKMKRTIAILLVICGLFAAKTQSQEAAPLKLAQTYKLPADVKGNFDHFAIDLKGSRLFATPEEYKAVLVLDLKTGNLIHKISGIEKPHAILFREDLKRLYVTDGEAGDVKIVDSDSYKIVSTVKLLEDADSIGYDPGTKFLYIDNGGGDVHQTYSMLSVVDTTAGKKVADMKVDGDTLEAMALDKSSSRIYLNNKAKSQVDVIDREKRTLITSWPVTLAKTNVAMAYDEANHRLFIACRSGGIVVFDTQSGKELSVLPITKGVDDLVFDAASKRLYASCDGDVSVYQQNTADNYKLLGKVTTGPMARTALLAPQLSRYFVAVPQHGTANAEIMVFEVQ